jgi:hypothetical protein
MMNKLVTIVAVLGIAASAQAALVYSVDGGTVTSDPNLIRYQVYVVPTAGENPGGFDGTISATNPCYLNQIFFGNTAPTPDMNFAQYLSASDQLLDTHFTLDPNLQKAAVNPAEDGPGSNPRQGTYLKGAIALQGGAGSGNNLHLAQVVIPVGTAAWIAGTVADALGAETPVSGPIPEPATVGLLIGGGLVVLMRKRR